MRRRLSSDQRCVAAGLCLASRRFCRVPAGPGVDRRLDRAALVALDQVRASTRPAPRRAGSARGRGRAAWCGSRCSSAPPSRPAGSRSAGSRPSSRGARPPALTSSASSSTENCSVNWLKTRNSPPSAGLLDRQLDAVEGVADVEEAAGLAAAAVDGERVADHRLQAEAVEDGAEGLVVVEAGDQALVGGGLVGLDPVDDALVEVGRPQAPHAAGEVDVGRVVDLRAVVQRGRQLRERQRVACAPCARSRCSPPRYRCWAGRTRPSSRA